MSDWLCILTNTDAFKNVAIAFCKIWTRWLMVIISSTRPLSSPLLGAGLGMAEEHGYKPLDHTSPHG